MSHTLVATLMKIKTGSPVSKLILLKLADNADIHGQCFPSYQYLARYCEVSVRTVKQHVKQLEAAGLIELVHRFDKRGRQRSNLYQIHTPLHLHVELESSSGVSFTRSGAGILPAGNAESALITSHKEKDLISGGKNAVAVRTADQKVREFSLSGQFNPFEQRIAEIIRQRDAARKAKLTGEE